METSDLPQIIDYQLFYDLLQGESPYEIYPRALELLQQAAKTTDKISMDELKAIQENIINDVKARAENLKNI